MKRTEIDEASSRTESNDCDNVKRRISLLEAARERERWKLCRFISASTRVRCECTPNIMLCQNEMNVVATREESLA